MNKTLLNYEPTTGTVSGPNGEYIGIKSGLPLYDEGAGKPGISELLKLKEAGFTAQEIIDMFTSGVL